MTHTEQQQPWSAEGPSMHDLVAADLRLLSLSGSALTVAALAQRKQLGLARYGRPLQAFNGRDAMRDAREEVLDLVVYLRQAIEEGREDLVELYRETLRLACVLVQRSISKDPSIGS